MYRPNEDRLTKEVPMNQYAVKTSDCFLLGYDQGAKDSRYHGGAIINNATAGCQW